MGNVVRVGLTVLLVAVCAAAQKRPTTFDFPLTSGTYWVYEGEVEWAPANAKPVKQKVRWKMEVVSSLVINGGPTIAKLLGHPSDLIWYIEGKPRQEHVVVRTTDGRYILDPVLEPADARQIGDQILDSAKGDAFFKEGVNPPVCVSEQDGKRDDGMYCWFLESKKRGSVSLKNIDAERELYRVGYRSNGSHEFITLATGIGIVDYEFGHHGSVSNVRMKLVEYHPAAPAGPQAPFVGFVPYMVQKPISFSDERRALTIAYRRQHSDPDAKDITIAPKMVILHWTAINSFDASWKYFNNVRAESGRTALANAGDVNVSIHFLVDRDGTIYQLMPETWMARHCIGLNHVAIGIENVGDGDKFPLTEAQVEANASLVRYLKEKYPDIQYLIGHSEYRQFEGTPLFVERDPKYRNTKPDPGPEFMNKVRERVKDIALKGPPTAESR